jgi:hypothetical protein
LAGSVSLSAIVRAGGGPKARKRKRGGTRAGAERSDAGAGDEGESEDLEVTGGGAAASVAALLRGIFPADYRPGALRAAGAKVAPASNASWVLSICSAGVVGKAGLSRLRGTEPVMATAMTTESATLNSSLLTPGSTPPSGKDPDG